MTAQIRVKVQRKAVVKLKVIPRLPANLLGDTFITITRNGLEYRVGVDYSVLTPGPITAPSTAFVAINDQAAGIYRTVSLASLLVSGLDADLQAIAALTGMGILSRTADGTWALRTITGTANEVTVTNGDGVAGAPTVSLPTTLTFTGKTVTGGSFNSGAFSGTYNGNTFTTGTGTLTLGAGKTATVSNTLTFTGTDASSVAFGTGGTVTYTSNNLSVFAATTSAQLAGVISDETGTGALVFASSPTLVAPTLGAATATTINSGSVIYNGATSGTTTVNASAAASGILTLPAATDTLIGKATTDTLTNKTFDTAGIGNSFKINSTAITAVTGSGSAVLATSPTLVTPVLGTPASGTATNLTGLPISTGLTGAGTGVLTALGVAVGSAGGPVVNGGALGTPSSATLTNATGLPLSGLASQAAYTITGNSTGLAASPTAISIPALTLKSSPASGDIVMIVDSAASNALKYTTVSALASAGSVSSIGGITGAITLAGLEITGGSVLTNRYSSNLLINPDFRINQRTYVSAIATAAGVYMHDRWKAGAGGCTYTFTQLASSTTITITAGTLIQVVEDKNVVGGTYTLSWTGTATARYGVNTATPSGLYVASPIVISSQTAGTTMSVEFSTGTVGAVKLEIGSVATPFVMPDYESEFARCKRYFTLNPPGIGAWMNSATEFNAQFQYQVEMRASPTFTLISGSSVATLPGTAAYSATGVQANGSGADTRGASFKYTGMTGPGTNTFGIYDSGKFSLASEL